MDRCHGDTIQQQTAGGHLRRRPLRSLVALALTLIVIFSSGGTSVAAQRSEAAFSDKRYVSELSDLEILVRGDFAILTTNFQRHTYGEADLVNIATLESFFSGSVLVDIGFFNDPDTATATLEFIKNEISLVMDSFHVLREDLTGTPAWSFAVASVEGEELLVYLQLEPDVVGNVDVVTALTGASQTFFADLEAAQVDITLDGKGIFPNVDPADLEVIYRGDGTAPNDDERVTPASTPGQAHHHRRSKPEATPVS